MVLVGIATAALIRTTPAPADLAGPVAVPPGTPSWALTHGDLLDEEQTLESEIPDHLWYGQVFTAYYATADQVPGQVVGLGVYSDAGLWSGVYLAGEAFHYAVLRNQAETAPTSGERQAAASAIPPLLGRIHLLVDADTLRVNIAGSWKAADPGAPTGHGFSPGVVDGQPGLLFRNCFPAGVPAWQENQDPATRDENVFGPLAWTGKPLPWEPAGTRLSYYCEDDVSRDEYIGTVYGLLASFDLVGGQDPALQAETRDDVLTMVGYLVDHQWAIVYPYVRNDPHGGPTTDPMVVPLFVQTPQAQLAMMQAAWHVAEVAGSPEQKLEWQARWAADLAKMGPNYLTDQSLAIQSPSEGYYGFNLNYLNSYDLIRLADNPADKELFRQGLAIVDGTVGNHLNAHFEAITYALTADPTKLDAAVTHLGQWIGYRANSYGIVDNSSRCGTTLTCEPEDQVTWTEPGPAGPVSVVQPGSSTTLRSSIPLPVDERPPTEFLWQRSPYDLDGSGSPTQSEPGVDFLSPYWMLRYYTEVAPPTPDPLPVWPGPHTS